MHQDQRIGLALGVLLVGACAAFFFRNETRTNPPAPRLQHAQELDDRIAERTTRPYLKGVEIIEAADRNRARTSADQESSDEDHSTDYWSPLDSPSGQFSSEKSTRDRKSRAKRLNDQNEVLELAPISIPNDNQALSNPGHSGDPAGSNTDAVTHRSNSKSSAPAGDGRTHVVQKGETLSSIAAKTLGSPNRFHELFEANQDQLSDPNALKPGMTIRIPDPHAEASPKPQVGKSRTAFEKESPAVEQSPAVADPSGDFVPPASIDPFPSPKNETQDSSSILLPPPVSDDALLDSPAEPLPVEDSGPAKKFVPARRVPLPGRTIGPQTRLQQPREAGGRKLSQASLESTSGKVAR